MQNYLATAGQCCPDSPYATLLHLLHKGGALTAVSPRVQHDAMQVHLWCTNLHVAVPHAAPAHMDAYAIVEVTQECVHIKGEGSVTSRQLRV